MKATALSTLQTLEPAATAATRIAVRRLMLTDFRCYRTLRLETDDRPVVLAGPNGAGKTNLLEALSFLVPGRGLRRARLGDVGRRAPTEETGAAWAVAASVTTPDGPVDIGTGLAEGDATGVGRRTVRIDGDDVRGQAALGQRIAAVWLTPDMDRLFSDGASLRRRFLDRLVYGFDPAHAGRISDYDRAMRERARLLRDDAGAADAVWLAALEDRMARNGVAIAAARRHVVGRLDAACASAAGAFPAAGLALVGEVEGWLADMPALDAEDGFRDRLAAGRAGDAASGRTLFGTHRGDLAVTHLGRGAAAANCSTGEQKAVLIRIVLANARLLSLQRATVPLLLLDELAAHLDAARRESLFGEIRDLGAQAWMTGTDATLFAPLEDGAQFFHVEDATLTLRSAPAFP